MTIAMSCKLTDTHTEVLVIDEVEKDKLKKQMENFNNQVQTKKLHQYSLFVVGDSLIKITDFGYQKLLMDIADSCSSFVKLN
jgi:hypothetical protein